MLNSTEHEILTAHKNQILKNKDFACFQTLRCCMHHADKCYNTKLAQHFVLEQTRPNMTE